LSILADSWFNSALHPQVLNRFSALIFSILPDFGFNQPLHPPPRKKSAPMSQISADFGFNQTAASATTEKISAHVPNLSGFRV
jgi:hypothetical protein